MKDLLHKQQFQQQLLLWFAKNQRSLPWRNGYQPYHVWISEIMGQQTQLERAAEYFARWIALFPTVEAIAVADETTVLKAWEGLGYYSRARNIQKAARVLVEEYAGAIPDSYQALLQLPGIGPYTAAAIASIGFNQPVPLLDANVDRIFARIFDIDLPVKDRNVRKKFERFAGELLVEDDARNWNQALMEFGALVCTPKNPDCASCVVQDCCQSYANDTVLLRPVVKKKEKRIDIFMSCAIIQKEDKFFIQQRMPDDLWGGLWEFPGGQLEKGETPEQAVIREVAEETHWQITKLAHFKTVTHFYTKYRVTLHSYMACLKKGSEEPILEAASHYTWVPLEKLSDYPYPSGHRKLVEALQKLKY